MSTNRGSIHMAKISSRESSRKYSRINFTSKSYNKKIKLDFGKILGKIFWTCELTSRSPNGAAAVNSGNGVERLPRGSGTDSGRSRRGGKGRTLARNEGTADWNGAENFFCLWYSVIHSSALASPRNSTEMQENMWARLRESLVCQGASRAT